MTGSKETAASVKKELSDAIDEVEDTVVQHSDALSQLQGELTEIGHILKAMNKRIDKLSRRRD